MENFLGVVLRRSSSLGGATRHMFLWWRSAPDKSLGGAPALKFLGWCSGAQVPWVALSRSSFLGGPLENFLGVVLRRSSSFWVVPRGTCSLGGAPALDKFFWVALRRSNSLGGAPALK